MRWARELLTEAVGQARYALAHGYGPLDDFKRPLTAAHSAAPADVWINRYGYLSDEKLSAIGELAR